MIPIHARLQDAKTLPSLAEACMQSPEVTKFNLEGSHGCVLLTLWVRYPTGVVAEQIYRYRLDARQNLVTFYTENFGREKRIPLVHALSQQFPKGWVARFFNVSGATITNDLKTFDYGVASNE